MAGQRSEAEPPRFRVHGVRYQTRDLDRAVAFYTGRLGFVLKHRQGDAFANVSCDGLDLLLSGASSSGAQPMPDGTPQEAGDGTEWSCARRTSWRQSKR